MCVEGLHWNKQCHWSMRCCATKLPLHQQAVSTPSGAQTLATDASVRWISCGASVAFEPCSPVAARPCASRRQWHKRGQWDAAHTCCFAKPAHFNANVLCLSEYISRAVSNNRAVQISSHVEVSGEFGMMTNRVACNLTTRACRFNSKHVHAARERTTR